MFGEFHVPTEKFALNETLQTVPNIVVEIERMVTTDEILTPYFWVSGGDIEEFEAAVEQDPSIEDP